jgi:hypothetical protein
VRRLDFMERPKLDPSKMRFSFTYIATGLALLFLLQGIIGSAPPTTVPYSRFQTMLEQGQIEEALIGANSIRFKLRADAPLPMTSGSFSSVTSRSRRGGRAPSPNASSR